MAKSRKSDKDHLIDWQAYLDNISKATPIDLTESKIDQRKRIDALEKNHEAWFKYYFPNFYSSEPAPFHVKATIRVMDNMEFSEVRPWARELAKTARRMMENLKNALTGKKRNFLMISSTFDNACRLLSPYRAILESNNRIINDYGVQKSMKKWEEGEFITKKGVAFRALGAGQSPRGTRNDEFRPDNIDFDDVDTDEEVRNKERIKTKIQWIEEAVMPTRSISSPLQVVFNGNIIGKYTVITEAIKKADYAKIVNIRDKEGKSTWPAKNSEEAIDRVLSQISYAAAQKEYFNNPLIQGTTFKSVNYGNCPPIRYCENVIVYGDPATSNNAEAKSSTKSLVVVGYKNLQYFVYKVYVDHCTNATFVNWLFDAHQFLLDKQVENRRIEIENNSLQNPHYEQVILPLIYQKAKTLGYNLPVIPDTRKKPEKFSRIEGTLEPIHRNGNLIFDKGLKDTDFMQTFEDQFLGVSPTSKTMDGPDGLEGAVWKIQDRVTHKDISYEVGGGVNRRY